MIPKLLSECWKGGNIAYFWTKHPDDRKESRWGYVDQIRSIPQGWNDVYFGVHPTAKQGSPSQRSTVAGDRGVMLINCVFADFDGKDFGDGKSGAMDHVMHLDFLPSVLVDSGGGYHAYWFLDETFYLDTEEKRTRAIGLQAGWVDLVKADQGSKDLARLLRVPGSSNFKRETPELVHVVSGFEDYGFRYTFQMLEEIAGSAAMAIADPQGAAHVPTAPISDQVDFWLEKYLKEARPGNRNETGFLLATQLRDTCRLTQAAAEQVGYPERVNQGDHEYTRHEWEDTVRSVFQRLPREEARSAIIPPPMDGARADQPPPAPQRQAPEWEIPQVILEAQLDDPLEDIQDQPDEIIDLVEDYLPEPEFPQDIPDLPGTQQQHDQPAAQQADPSNLGFTVAELREMQFPPQRWIIPNLITEGLTILGGRPKVGKSWLALQISHSVGTGGMIFDRKIEPGSVLFLAYEDNKRRLLKRIDSQKIPNEASIRFIDDFPRLHEGGIEALFALYESGQYRLIVIDTLNRAISGVKERDRETVVDHIFDTLQRFAMRRGAAVIMIDHTRKPMATFSDPIDDIIGQTSKASTADAIMAIYRKQGIRGSQLMGRGRDIEDIDWKIYFDPATTAWQLEGETEEIEFTEQADRVLHALSQLGKAQVGDIAQATGQNRGNCYKRLADLVNKGIVRSETIGRNVFYSIIEK